MEFVSEQQHRAWVASQSSLPRGFQAGACRIEFTPREVAKPAAMTVSLVALDQPTPDFAAVFTRNAFPGAPVVIGRSRLHEPLLRAIVVNNKISNVCAPDGVAASERVCAAVAAQLECAPAAVLPSSTGVIGWQLPVDAMTAAIPELVASLQGDSILPVAEGIMTTDLYPKVRRVDLRGGSLVGIAKGAGMIEPNLATMLVYLLTDLRLDRDTLRELLTEAVEGTFNAISIDSDQSTSDTVALVSSRCTPCHDRDGFAAALKTVCAQLADDVVRNGEGVHHVIRVTVNGAPDCDVARGVGKAVVNSPLFQCAVCGNDPNVGRLVCAVGDYLGNHQPGLSTAACTMDIGGHRVFDRGAFQLTPDTEVVLAHHLRQAQLYESAPPDDHGVFTPPISWPPHERCVEITVDLGVGPASAVVTGADRTHEYISENADYRS